jgi:predicted XRE-type DNA-binding protein
MAKVDNVDDDPVFEALTSLSVVAASSARDLNAVEEGLDAMRRRRRRGLTWAEIFGAKESTNPLSAVTKIAADLGRASAVLRRALASALRNEGLQVTQIAELFEVSRQRVSALVRPRRHANDSG